MKFGYIPGYCGINPSIDLYFLPSFDISSPSKVTVPLSRRRFCVIMFMSVDLPEPLGPRRAYIPGVKTAEKPDSARFFP